MSRAQLTSTVEQNTGGAVSPYVAGKNKIINGDFGIWQRGTSITLSSGANGAFGPDRFIFEAYGSSTAGTVTRQAFTPGSAPVTGYEGQYFARLTNFATATAWQIRHRIENVQTFAGQTVTFSFWAKASTALTNAIVYEVQQNFGTGGVPVFSLSNQSITTSWARYSTTIPVPSISGKTIGTSSYIEFNFYQGSGATNSSTIDTWGWQVEAGSVATPFTTATGTLSGELQACQRYYWRGVPTSTYSVLSSGGFGTTSTTANIGFALPVPLRVEPSSIDFSTIGLWDSTGAVLSITAVAKNNSGNNTVNVSATVASGVTANRPYQILSNGSTSGYIGFSAEL